LTGETLIEQALRLMTSSGRPRSGDQIVFTSAHALVWVLYSVTRDAHLGRGSPAEIDRCARAARNAGIAESDITAAILAAERDRGDSPGRR
jgi:hypothetical protein